MVQIIEQWLYESHPNNDKVIEVIKACGDYLNLCTISQYAKQMGKSYNGVKKHRHIETIFGCKLVIDNT